MHLYFFGIIILPMLLGMVMVIYLEAKMIEYYFRLMIENMSSRIQGQASIIQTEMLLTNKGGNVNRLINMCADKISAVEYRLQDQQPRPMDPGRTLTNVIKFTNKESRTDRSGR